MALAGTSRWFGLPAAVPQLIAATIALAGVLLGAWLRARRGRPGRNTSDTALRFVATSPWMLEQFCARIGTVLREWPELSDVTVDVQALDVLDEATILALQVASAIARRREASVRIDGHTAQMMRAAVTRGMAQSSFGQPRAMRVSTGTIH